MCVKKEEYVWEFGLANSWVKDVAGQARRSPSPSSEGRVKVLVCEVIIVLGTEGDKVEITVVGPSYLIGSVGRVLSWC